MPKRPKAATSPDRVAETSPSYAPANPLSEPADDPHELFPEIPHAKKRAFLVAYAQCGVRVQAARMIGIDDRIHWYWLKHDPQYARAFQDAERFAGDAAEDKAYQLALNGYEEGVWHKGEQVGSQVRYLPTLLAMILNAAKPDKYKYRQSVEHTISPALEALQRQWQQAALPPASVSVDAPERHVDATDAEFETLPTPPMSERPSMPGAPTTQEIFQALDTLNNIEELPDEDELDSPGSSA